MWSIIDLLLALLAITLAEGMYPLLSRNESGHLAREMRVEPKTKLARDILD